MIQRRRSIKTIGNHGELIFSFLESKPMTLEKSFMWLLKSVAPTMKLIKEFGGIYHVNLLGLIIQSTKLNEEGEKVLVAVKENPEYFRGKLKYYRRTIDRKKRKSEALQTIIFKTLHSRQVEYNIFFVELSKKKEGRNDYWLSTSQLN